MQEKTLPAAGRATAPTIGCMVVASMTLASVAWAGPAPPSGNEAQQAAQVIERALQKHGADVHRCFERLLADRLDTAGKMEIEV